MIHASLDNSGPELRETLYLEPSQLAARLKGETHLTLLESVLRQEHLGRYSFLACNPAATLRVDRGGATLDGLPLAEPPLQAVDRLLTENRMPHVPGLPPFQGGLAGYIAYEFGRRLEPQARIPDLGSPCPELILHLYDAVVTFDHMQEKAWIVSTGRPARDDAERRRRARQRADELELLLARRPAAPGSHVIAGWHSNFTRANYEQAVARTVDYVLAGDIFQANIAQCFEATIPTDFDALAFYRRLRERNAATFAAYLDCGDHQIASSSPERLVNFDGTAIEARPIKGTRRRDADPARDAALVAELASSRKDRAENVMIVDLLRNDLSRVSKPGSVRVPVLCGLETYASVHHLTSVVTGALRDDRTLGDLIAAVFPGGSITGAPKIRAMEIIAEIERTPRGIYCGSIGYMGFSGHADFNIAIRTALFAGGKARVEGGGGITARSQPAAEYEETLTKIQRIMEAFAP